MKKKNKSAEEKEEIKDYQREMNWLNDKLNIKRWVLKGEKVLGN